MNKYPLISITSLIASITLLVGCATQTTTNDNTNQMVNTNLTNENTNEVVTNSNENTNEVSDLDTSDWLTYTNEEYGFGFKYPSDWKVKELARVSEEELLSLYLAPKTMFEDSLINIQVKTTTLDDEYQSYINSVNKSSNSEIMSEQKIILASFEAQEVTVVNRSNNHESKTIFVEREEVVFIISGSIDESPFVEFINNFIWID